MNFPGVFPGDEKMHAEMAIARAAGKTSGGHIMPLLIWSCPFTVMWPVVPKMFTKAPVC
ncbi:MAG: hypothetical protein R6V20_05435 [Desulfobia sp.]